MDPVTAHGMSNAFADADLLAAAITTGFGGRASLAHALGHYRANRDGRAVAMYDFTVSLAALHAAPACRCCCTRWRADPTRSTACSPPSPESSLSIGTSRSAICCRCWDRPECFEWRCEIEDGRGRQAGTGDGCGWERPVGAQFQDPAASSIRQPPSVGWHVSVATLGYSIRVNGSRCRSAASPPREAQARSTWPARAWPNG